MSWLSVRHARPLAWSLMGLYLGLAITGLALQAITRSPLAGIPLPMHIFEVMALCVQASVGALIVSQQPRHPLGWVWCFLALSFIWDHFTWGYAVYGALAHPGSLPGVEIAIVMQYFKARGTLGMLGFTLLFLLFPSGRPLSPRWGKMGWIALAALAVQIPASALASDPSGYFPFPADILAMDDSLVVFLTPLREFSALLSLLCVAGASSSLFVRLRRARGIERQQIKGIVYAATFFPPALIFIFLGERQPGPEIHWLTMVGVAVGLSASAAMSIATAVAVLRYRLWEIDIIIRRTLVYGLLTAALAVVYFASAVLFQQSFQVLTGQRSPLAVVLSTLAIAVLFSPLRRRIQDFIDRRFYRQKYDAQQTLAAFSVRMRDQVELEQLSKTLLAVVEETIQPAHASLWIKKLE